MNLRQLSYFIAVTEQGSIVKAAEALHISQPSVSMQIKLLEDDLEVQLFERRQSGTILTPEGREFLSYARSALDTLAAGKATLRSHQATEVGMVTVGIPGSLSAMLSLPLIATVQRQCPNIKLKVITGLSGHLSKWILDGTLDFGLVYIDAPVFGLGLELLMKEHLFLAISEKNSEDFRRQANNGDIAFANICHTPLVMPSREHGLRALVEKVSSRVGLKLDVHTELDASELLVRWVLQTCHATILSLAALQGTRLREGELYTAHIVDPVIERRVSLAYAADRPLTRTARRVEMIVRDLLKSKLNEGWWKFAQINE